MKTMLTDLKEKKSQQDKYQVKNVFVYIIFSFSLLFGIYNLIFNGLLRQYGQPPWDFAQYYVAGQAWSRQENPYDLQVFQAYVVPFLANRPTVADQASFGLLYPPQLYWIVVPFSSLPPQVANDIFAIISLCVWILGFIFFGGILWKHSMLNLLVLSSLFLLLGSIFVRDSFTFGQINGFLFCILMLSLFLIDRDKTALAGFILALLAIKPQLVVVPIALFLIRRDWRLIGGFVIGSLFFTLIPIILSHQMPLETIIGWLNRIRGASGGINAAVPHIVGSSMMIHSEVLVTRLLGQQSQLSTLINIGLILTLSIIAIYPILTSRRDQSTSLIDFAIGSALSVNIFYNRWYGLFMLVPGILFILLYASRLSTERSRFLWFLWLSLIIIVLAMPTSLFWDRMFVLYRANPDNTLLTVSMAYQAALGLWVTCSLIYLRWKIYLNKSQYRLY